MGTMELTDVEMMVIRERRRQVELKGWTADHDDEHIKQCLAKAAAAYLIASLRSGVTLGWWTDAVDRLWPFGGEAFKPREPHENLTRAAALLIAELERIERANLRAGKGKRNAEA